jgi:hypothetical protein
MEKHVEWRVIVVSRARRDVDLKILPEENLQISRFRKIAHRRRREGMQVLLRS